MQYMAVEKIQFRNKKVEAGDIFTIKNEDAIKPLIESGKVKPLPEAINDLIPEQREAFEERAGIMQFDGGMSKEEAERFAWCFSVCMLTEGMSRLCERVKPCPKYKESHDADR